MVMSDDSQVALFFFGLCALFIFLIQYAWWGWLVMPFIVWRVIRMLKGIVDSANK